MKKNSKAYGYAYNRSGELVQVAAPVSSNGKKFAKPNQTTFGKIGVGVGFAMSGKK